MKISGVFSYVAVCLIIIFSTNLFAADATFGKPRQLNTATTASPATLNKTAKLPSQIKINPADINVASNFVDLSMTNAKNAGQKINQGNAKIAQLLPVLEQSISTYKNKVNECKNKIFTTEDQKKAGCTDDMTISQCSKYLFSDCIYYEINTVISYSRHLVDEGTKMEGDIKEFKKNVLYINNNAGTIKK